MDRAGNPASNLLRDWLTVIDTWSTNHPTAAPITVALDIKDDLTDNTSYAAGNLAALNQELVSVFGAKLLRASDYPATPPTVGALRGRVLALLSGNARTRALYKRDSGTSPAVAMNGRGQVAEVHDSGSGDLWYWSGTYGSDGTVTWLRHGRYDSGMTPAVALNDDGDLVEVHRSQNATTLWYRVGRLAADGEITWSPSRQYDNGVLPTIRFDATGTRLREIHRSQSNSQNWTWAGALDPAARTVTWTGNAKTADPPATTRPPRPPARPACASGPAPTARPRPRPCASTRPSAPVTASATSRSPSTSSSRATAPSSSRARCTTPPPRQSVVVHHRGPAGRTARPRLEPGLGLTGDRSPGQLPGHQSPVRHLVPEPSRPS
ncbi:hypothetical protein ACFSTC_03995 [Nonomuraea ferruginea]